MIERHTYSLPLRRLARRATRLSPALGLGPTLGLGLALGLTALSAAPAMARDQKDVLQAAILPGWRTEDGARMVALRLDLAPKWKTYWRAPGDAGIPPSFDWSGSENVKSVRYHWPRPVVFKTNGMQTIGYHDRLVLPVEVVPRDASKPVVLRTRVDLGICNEICMPAAIELSARLEGPGAPDRMINEALADRPATAGEAGLSGIACTVEPSKDGLTLRARMDMPSLGADETVVIEAGPEIWVDETDTRRTGGALMAEAEMISDDRAPFALDRSTLTVTVIGSDRAVEIKGCPAP